MKQIRISAVPGDPAHDPQAIMIADVMLDRREVRNVITADERFGFVTTYVGEDESTKRPVHRTRFGDVQIVLPPEMRLKLWQRLRGATA